MHPFRNSGVRVLVVEDEPRMATLLERGFREEGYAVDVAHDGTDGLWLATENDYDAIVLDVMLPGIDGFEVCRRMRAAERWAPVLLLTARGRGRRPGPGPGRGCRRLPRPSRSASPSSRHGCGRWSGARAGDRPAVLRSVTSGSTRRCTGRGGATTELALSPKEMALLELLMRHAGEVVTRTQILDHVWDFAYDGGSNVVDQYVAYLRRKIDRPFGRDDIETVRGVGYRLRAPRTACEPMPIRIRLAGAVASSPRAARDVGRHLFLRSFRHGLETSKDPGLRSQAQALVDDVKAEPDGFDLLNGGAGLATNETVAQVSHRVASARQHPGSRAPRRCSRRSAADRWHEGAHHRPRQPGRTGTIPGAGPRRAGARRRRTVVVGSSLEATEAAVDRARDALLLGGARPRSVAGGCVVLAAAALRPVERMRPRSGGHLGARSGGRAQGAVDP